MIKTLQPPQHSGSAIQRLYNADDPVSQLAELESTEKWHPVTYAVANGNLDLAQYLINTCLCNTRKVLKVPGLFATQLFNRLFPLIVSVSSAT